MANAAPLRQSTASGPNVSQELPSDFRGGNKSLGLSGLLHKVRRNWRDYGWKIAFRKTLAYLVRPIYFRQVYRIYRIDIVQPGSKRSPDPLQAASKLSLDPLQAGSNPDRPASTVRTRRSPDPADAKPPVDGAIPNFTFKILNAENRDAIGQIESIAEWLGGRLQGAIAAGQPCLVALDGDRVAGFNLVSLERASIPLVNLTRELRMGSAWSEHIAVSKQYRGMGLGVQLRFRIFRELQRRGVRRLYGGTLLSNAASLNLARSAGFEEIADIHYRKFFSREKWRCERVRR